MNLGTLASSIPSSRERSATPRRLGSQASTFWYQSNSLSPSSTTRSLKRSWRRPSEPVISYTRLVRYWEVSEPMGQPEPKVVGRFNPLFQAKQHLTSGQRRTRSALSSGKHRAAIWDRGTAFDPGCGQDRVSNPEDEHVSA